MPSIKGYVEQSANDTATEKLIETGLTLNGKQGWAIKGVAMQLNTRPAPTVGGWNVQSVLQTETGAQSPADNDFIVMVDWTLYGPAVNTGMMLLPLSKHVPLVQERLTVQPELIVRLSSYGAGVKVACYFEVFFEQVTLTDLEVMTLYQAGA